MKWGVGIMCFFCMSYTWTGAASAYGDSSPIQQNVTFATSTTVAQGEALGPFFAEHINDSDVEMQFSVQQYVLRPDGMIEWLEPSIENLGPGETATNVYFIDVPLSYAEGEYVGGLVVNDAEGRELRGDSFQFTVRLPSYTNSLGMEFKLIPSGIFMMGSPTNQLGRDSDELRHPVKISTPYYMQVTEVTQYMYEMVMGVNPSCWNDCPSCPVEMVSWYDAQSFISKMNRRGEGVYRLPTEAEWEYACRAGSNLALANGPIVRTDCGFDPYLNAVGIYCGNSDRPVPVAQKEPNAWGLYDMHGNVWEWCQDWYGAYSSHYTVDPTGPAYGWAKVFRGGTFYYDVRACRSANRGRCSPTAQRHGRGFRLVREL